MESPKGMIWTGKSIPRRGEGVEVAGGDVAVAGINVDVGGMAVGNTSGVGVEQAANMVTNNIGLNLKTLL